MINLKLNWQDDDGINLPMINDVARNTFYDTILSKNVKDKICCDVGFGTGLLSLLALKHGAKHIVAYEKDFTRFELGQWVIDKLDLSKVIELRNELATSDQLVNDHCELIFHEIIHQGLWREGVWWIRPQTPNITYLPGNLFFELYASEISDSAVTGFLQGSSEIDYFNPGINIDTRFINLINQLIVGNDSKHINALDNKDYLINTSWDLIHKHWSWSPLKVFSQNKKYLLASYQVDYNTCETTFYDSIGTRTTDFSTSNCRLVIDTTDWQYKNMLLELRFGLKHGNDCLYLDDCRGWGEQSPRLFIKPSSNLIFTQDFTTGDFNLSKG